jgi:diacylglycerol kinase family enzyme
MTTPLLGVVVNPRARVCRVDPNFEAKLKYALGGYGPTVVAWDQGHVENTLRDWAARGIDLIGIVGGDGTNLYSLTAIIRAYGEGKTPRIAFLGGGTNDVTKRGFGFDGAPLDLLERVIGLARSTPTLKTIACDVLRIFSPQWRESQWLESAAKMGSACLQSATQPRDDLYAFFFGAGLVARFYQLYYESGAPSRLRAARIAGLFIGSVALGLPRGKEFLAPVPSTVTLDGETFAGPHRVFLAAKMDRVVFGLRPTYRAREQIGRFHVLLANEPASTYAAQIPRLFQGRGFTGARHIDRLASRMEIHFESDAPYMADGELLRGRDITVTNGPVLDVVDLR